MNLMIRITVIAIVGAVLQTFWPWWTCILVAMVVEMLLGRKDGTSFFSGFYGVALPWMALSAYIDVTSDSLLTLQVLRLFKLPEFSVVLIIITGLLGGLVAGLGSVTGGWIRTAIHKTDG